MSSKQLISDSLSVFNTLKEVASEWEKNDPERFKAMRNSMDFILFQLSHLEEENESSEEEE
jgi:hypothetical protein